MSYPSYLDTAWQGLLSAAASLVAEGNGDLLVVLPRESADLEVWKDALADAAQHDDGVSALAAIDVLRVLVALYDAEEI